MAKLAEHCGGTDADLDWILTEQELTFPFKPIEALAQSIIKEKNNTVNPILTHSKTVRLEVYKKCVFSHYTQKNASTWNIKIEIKRGKQTIYWA